MQLPPSAIPNTTTGGRMLPNNIPRPSIPLPRSTIGYEPAPKLPGFFVEREDEIMAGDVPMDGSISYFPSRDLTHIYVRQWSQQGVLERLTYAIVRPEQEQQQRSQIPKPADTQENTQTNQMAEVLSNLTNGLNNTFSQIGQTLTAMQTKMDAIDKRLGEAPHYPIDDGGMG